MKSKTTLRTFLAIAGSAALTIPYAHAATGTWNVDANGLWSTTGNWTPGIADGSTFAANFTNNITGDRTVSLDGVRTLTSVVFGDSNTATAGSWILDNNGTSTNTLILAGTTPGITVNALGASKTGTISAIIEGTVGLVKSGTGTLILSGANTYTGTTAINQGTVQINTGGTLGATTALLSMGTGADGVLGNAVNLSLNTSATVGAFTVKSNTSDATTPANINQLSIASGSTLTASTFTVGVAVVSENTINTALSTGSTPGAGGTLTVSGATSIGLTGGASLTASTTVVDLRGLHTFNSGALNVGSARNSKAALYLANNANTINGAITVGDSKSSNNYNIAGISHLYLGAGVNALQSATITLGKIKGAGQILFAGPSGSVTITGANGIGTSAITIGDHTRSSFQGTAPNSLLLAGHTAAVSASTVILGSISGNNAAGGNTMDNLLTFDTGNFNATSIEMGKIANTTTILTHATNSTFTVGGDTANSTATGIVNVSGNILLGNNDGITSSTGATSGTLTINGGTVNVNTAAAATGGIFDGSTNVVSGVSLTSTLTLEGGTLNLNGGRIGGTGLDTGSVGARDIDNLNFRSGTLMNVRSINGAGGLTKTTSGTLVLDGTNLYTGGTSVSEGILVFRNTGAKSASGTHAFAVSTTLGLGVGAVSGDFGSTDITSAFAGGTMSTNLSNVTVTTTTNVAVDTTAGNFTHNDDVTGSPTKSLTKLGINTLTLGGNNTYSGATTVSGGTLAIGTGGSINSSSGITIASGAHFKYNSSTALTVGITNNGGRISGTGTIGVAVVMDSTSDIIAPGNSPGIQPFGTSQTWSSLTYEWETNNFAGTTAGTDFDQINITGTLNLTGAVAGSYILDLISLTALNAAGSVPNFSEVNRSWAILTATGGITGFDASYWTIDHSAGLNTFTSSPTWGGSWLLSLNDTAGTDSLVLTYTAIPEPRAALLGGLGLLMLLRRRR